MSIDLGRASSHSSPAPTESPRVVGSHHPRSCALNPGARVADSFDPGTAVFSGTGVAEAKRRRRSCDGPSYSETWYSEIIREPKSI